MARLVCDLPLDKDPAPGRSIAIQNYSFFRLHHFIFIAGLSGPSKHGCLPRPTARSPCRLSPACASSKPTSRGGCINHRLRLLRIQSTSDAVRDPPVVAQILANTRHGWWTAAIPSCRVLQCVSNAVKRDQCRQRHPIPSTYMSDNVSGCDGSRSTCRRNSSAIKSA
jgi:hypothetical protein